MEQKHYTKVKTWLGQLVDFDTALKSRRGDFIRFGGHSVSKTPGPFPNPAVKCHRANGTATQVVGE